MAHGERGEIVLLVSERGETSGDAYDIDALVGHVADARGMAMTVAGVTRDVLPRQAAGLRAVKAVVLDAVDPESLDAAQRGALLAYLNGGGVVVMSAPVAAVGRGGSWFERHFPV
ncbi:MAG: hypothetical protein M3478_11385 [Planctomycetota bacterium]|nr:hypothetical protein [Planctomycetota bacterium]